MKLRTPLCLGAAVVAIVGGAAMPALAAPGDTSTTFTLAGGTLGVTVQGSAALTDGVSGDATVSGSLGAVAVADARGGTAGWTVDAVSTAFTDGGTSSSTGVTYTSGTVSQTGTATTSGSTAVSIDSSAQVAAATGVSGNNTASWTPNITVAMPGSSLAGNYTGTVTTSIL